MRGRRLFWGNVSFERQLEPARGALPRQLQRLEAELSCLWLAMAQPGDVIYSPETISTEFARRLPNADEVEWWDGHSTTAFDASTLQFTPWGWSQSAVQQARRWGCAVDAPPVDIVRLCNSREFSSTREQQLECGLSGAIEVRSSVELSAAVYGLEAEQRWVIKANLGSAARERVIGQGLQPTESMLQWCQRRFDQGQSLYFEPWVHRVVEVGIQWDVPKLGEPQLVGIAELLTSERGEYRGSRIANGDSDEWSDVVAVQLDVVSHMQRLGYFGPVGIDAMRYRDATGQLRERPLQDINARLTMGRIALEWSRRFATGGQWLHAPSSPGATAVATSPEQLGASEVQHRTWWIAD